MSKTGSVMGDHSYAVCLIGVMDQLWFNKIVLFSQPLLIPKAGFVTPPSFEEVHSFESSTDQSSMAAIPEEDSLVLTSSTSFTPLQDDYSSGKEEENEKEIEFKERPTRQNTNTRKSRSHSSSPSNQTGSRSFRYSSPVTRILQKTMSCKTLSELEEEEVKGFIDLGFTFDTENLCPRMMSVVPGLQRLGGCNKNEEKDEENGGGESKGEVLRPYLSEAWLIKRPDSPLLNLKVPRETTMAGMKKHLKNWARTVASVIQQES